VYAFTIVSYVLLFATLLAAGGTFFYQEYIDNQLTREIESLNNEISSFSDANMQRVLEFDKRLAQAGARLENSVSVASLFEALEAATIDTVQLQSLSLTRENDERFDLSARILTDTFDSTIFQRGVFERNEVIDGVEIVNVQTSESLIGGGASEVRPIVTFDAALDVSLSAIPYVVTSDNSVPFTITNPVDIFDTATSSATTTADNNEMP
tara:strand:- start:11090 stop:11719 length:630 start_codon:yes stop_codon:yes gene_type:complete